MKRTAFDFPITLARGAEPMRTQLLRELRSALQSGRLRAGSALPSSRVLAADLGVSRGLVVAAYEQLAAEGYLVARRGSATRVASRAGVTRRGSASRNAAASRSGPDGASAAAWRPRFDFRPGIPDVSLFPARAWMRALRRAWANGAAAVLDYPDPRGVEPARIALAAYLNRSRATVADAERVVLCTGFAQAARLVAEVLRARGVRRIAVEDPGHAEQCADLRAAGLELVPVPVDEGGLCVEALAGLNVGAVLVTPAHQYPTGAVLDPQRRSALLRWADARHAFVLEDDYDAEYRYDRAPVGALQGLAPERVIYIGTASKMLAPSLRQGWLVLPHALVADTCRAKLSADRGSPALEQLALAHFLDAGELDRHLRRTRAIYARRRDALVAAFRRHLPAVRLSGAAAGLHLLITLPLGSDEARVVAVAAQADIRIYGARDYHASPAAAPPALLLGYGGIPEEEIDAGVSALVRVIAGGRSFLRAPSRPRY